MIISVPFVEEKVVCTPIIMKLVNSNEPGSFFSSALSGNYCHEGKRGRGKSEKKNCLPFSSILLKITLWQNPCRCQANRWENRHAVHANDCCLRPLTRLISI